MVVAFSSCARILGQCSTIQSLHALFFFKVEISSHKLIPLFRPGSVNSGSVRWDDCNWIFPDALCVSSFPDRFPHSAWTSAWSAYSNFDGSRVYACLGVTYHLRFWQNDQGLLCATAVTWGWKGHLVRVSIQSWLRRRKNTSYTDRQILQPVHPVKWRAVQTGNIHRQFFFFFQ